MGLEAQLPPVKLLRDASLAPAQPHHLASHPHHLSHLDSFQLVGVELQSLKLRTFSTRLGGASAPELIAAAACAHGQRGGLVDEGSASGVHVPSTAVQRVQRLIRRKEACVCASVCVFARVHAGVANIPWQAGARKLADGAAAC